MEHLKKSFAVPAAVLFVCAMVFASGCAQEESSKPSASKSEASGAPASGSEIAAVTGVPQKPEVPAPSTLPITEEKTYYGFERGGLDGWEVPQWAMGKNDYVASGLEVSDEAVSEGASSMKVNADFPGGYWTAALVEIQQYLDLSKYRVIRADVYLPADAPKGLSSSIILTVGDSWRFVEMSRSYPLIPGEWITVTASIEPGSYDWKRIVPDEKFAEDVRKIAIRVESNNKPKYKGGIFIDNVRVGR
jgi:hypothetical protein